MSNSNNTNSNNTNSNILKLYHKKLNHVSKNNLIKTLNQIKSINLSLKSLDLNQVELTNCESCLKGKFTRVISREPLKDTSKALAIIDCNIAGPFNTISYKGERYFITLTDRASRAI